MKWRHWQHTFCHCYLNSPKTSQLIMGVALDTCGEKVCTWTSTWDDNKMARRGWWPKERRRDCHWDFLDSVAENTKTFGNPCTKQYLQWDPSQPSLQLLIPNSFLSPLQPPPVKEEEEEELPSQQSMVMMIHCLGEESLVAHLVLLPAIAILAGRLHFGRGCQECPNETFSTRKQRA